MTDDNKSTIITDESLAREREEWRKEAESLFPGMCSIQRRHKIQQIESESYKLIDLLVALTANDIDSINLDEFDNVDWSEQENGSEHS